MTEDTKPVTECPGAPAIVVFAKPPRSGRSKTRLAAEIGRELADRFAAAFLADTLDRCQALARAVDGPVAGCPVWLAGDGVREDFAEFLDTGVSFVSQCEGHLGERMAAVCRHLRRQGRGMVALGADTPQLPEQHLEDAVRGVAAGARVIGPARDGGYYVLGVPVDGAADAVLFHEHPWGSDQVLASTRARLEQNGLSWQELPLFWDIDHRGDLVQWKDQRDDPRFVSFFARSGVPRRTLELLDGVV